MVTGTGMGTGMVTRVMVVVSVLVLGIIGLAVAR
jgi:hypothetical protein